LIINQVRSYDPSGFVQLEIASTSGASSGHTDNVIQTIGGSVGTDEVSHGSVGPHIAASCRYVVADRDGTVIEERHYLRDPDQVALVEGVAAGLRELQRRGIGLVIVTNQSGIARGYFTADTAQRVNDRVRQLLAEEGVRVAGIYTCPHLPEERCTCRKPGTALVEQAAAEHGFTPDTCIVVGDKPCDIELGHRFGAPSVLVRSGYGDQYPGDALAPTVVLDHLGQLAALLPGGTPGHPAGDAMMGVGR